MVLDYGGMAALLGGLLIVALIVGLALYVYTALVVMALAKKTDTPNGWLAFIPIANVYLMTQIAGIHGLWTLAILLAIIPIVGPFIFLGLTVWWWWKICERVGRPGWWGILLLIPIVNLVLMGMLAWGKSE